MRDKFFNHQLLVVARQARRMSQESLAKRAEITQGYLSKIEHGLLVPPSKLIKTFSEILEFPEGYFEQTYRVCGPPLSVHRGTRFGPKGYR